MKDKKFDNHSISEYNLIHPEIAKNLIELLNRENIQIENFKCLDIGSGGGYLGIELAKTSREIDMTLLDISLRAKEDSINNIEKNNLEDRVNFILSNVEYMPFENESFDLIVSSASMHMWENKEKAIKEIYRILKKSSYLYIGRGFASVETKNKVEKAMIERNVKGWVKKKDKRLTKEDLNNYKDIFISSGFKIIDIVNEENGYWFFLRKI